MASITPPMSRSVALFMLIGGALVVVVAVIGMFFSPGWMLGAMIGLGLFLAIRGGLGLRSPRRDAVQD